MTCRMATPARTAVKKTTQSVVPLLRLLSADASPADGLFAGGAGSWELAESRLNLSARLALISVCSALVVDGPGVGGDDCWLAANRLTGTMIAETIKKRRMIHFGPIDCATRVPSGAEARLLFQLHGTAKAVPFQRPNQFFVFTLCSPCLSVLRVSLVNLSRSYSVLKGHAFRRAASVAR